MELCYIQFAVKIHPKLFIISPFIRRSCSKAKYAVPRRSAAPLHSAQGRRMNGGMMGTFRMFNKQMTEVLRRTEGHLKGALHEGDW